MPDQEKTDPIVRATGRVILKGKIETLSGLRIGGSSAALAIGAVDLNVIRDARTGRPYIPGSSLKGKMRSLAEKWLGAPQNMSIARGNQEGQGKVRVHVAKDAGEYKKFWVNPIFGVTGDTGPWATAPTRLIVRDVPMLSDPQATPPLAGSAEELLSLNTDLPYTEVKWEAAIDRVTSAAVPRQVERVPAGTVFSPLELVLGLYNDDTAVFVDHVITALQLLEDDYLGSHGSRGSGKIAFRDLALTVRVGVGYQEVTHGEFSQPSQDLSALIAKRGLIQDWVSTVLADGKAS